MTAETKRAQFQASRSVAIPERRPKLIRAMSAPIRPAPIAIEPSVHIQSKKRFHRKKINQENERYQVQIQQQQLYLENNIAIANKDEKCTTRTKFKKSSQIRARSAIGACDIVTLVSLLSPGTSDSEKEDASLNKNECSTGRAPSLRKCGKSGKKLI